MASGDTRRALHVLWRVMTSGKLLQFIKTSWMLWVLALRGQRISELRERATELATGGRTDLAAVANLRRMAGLLHRRYLLLVAQSRSRDGENLIAYTANQLLAAAATDQPVVLATVEQKGLFDRIADLTFAKLVELQPALADIPGRTEEESRLDALRRVKPALTPLVGPAADAEDPLVRSHNAYEIARDYLLSAEKRAMAGVLTGHTSAINALDFVEIDERPMAITGSDDHTARIWDLSTGTVHAVLTGHTDTVTAVGHTFLMPHMPRPDDVDVTLPRRVAVTGSRDGTARVWDWNTGEQVHSLIGHTGPVTAVNIGFLSLEEPLLAVTASADGTARVWQLRDGVLRYTLAGHTGPLTDVAYPLFSARHLTVTASVDGTARAWDLATGELVHVFAGHSGPVTLVRPPRAFDQLRLMLTAGADGAVRLWHQETGELQVTLTGHTGPVTAADFAFDDDSWLVTASADGTARVWDVAAAEHRLTVAPDTGPLTAVVTTDIADTPYLVTGGADGAIRLWDLDTGAQRATFTAHTGPVAAMQCRVIGHQPCAITTGADGSLRVSHLSV